MKKDDLIAVLLVVGSLLYVGAHVVLPLLRPVFPALMSIVPK